MTWRIYTLWTGILKPRLNEDGNFEVVSDARLREIKSFKSGEPWVLKRHLLSYEFHALFQGNYFNIKIPVLYVSDFYFVGKTIATHFTW